MTLCSRHHHSQRRRRPELLRACDLEGTSSVDVSPNSIHSRGRTSRYSSRGSMSRSHGRRGSSLALALIVLCIGWCALGNAKKDKHADEHVSSDGASGTRVVLKHAVEELGARCIDGSPPVYYISEGRQQNKWMIYQEGGDWCERVELVDEETQEDGAVDHWSCSSRADMWLGSSRYEEDVSNKGDMIKYGRQYEYMSRLPDKNPMMHDWMHVWVRYCDGGSYSGDAPLYHHEHTRADGKGQLFFRGKAVLQAVMDDLVLRRGLRNATDVVLAGASAGGLGALAQADDWSAHIRKAASAAGLPKHRMAVIVDSGFFPPFEDETSSGCRYVERMHSVLGLHMPTSKAIRRCEADHADDKASCLFGTVLVKYVRVPVFVMSSIFDHYMLRHILCGEDPKQITSFGLGMQSDLIAAIKQGPRNAAFLDSCVHHTRCWNDVRVDEDTPASAFEAWYNGETTRRVWAMNRTFYSTHCRAFHAPRSCKMKRHHFPDGHQLRRLIATGANE